MQHGASRQVLGGNHANSVLATLPCTSYKIILTPQGGREGGREGRVQKNLKVIESEMQASWQCQAKQFSPEFS